MNPAPCNLSNDVTLHGYPALMESFTSSIDIVTMARICSNLTALESFPTKWIREVGDRIQIPVRGRSRARWAFLWHRAGLSHKQVAKLAGNKGNPIPPDYVERYIECGRERVIFDQQFRRERSESEQNIRGLGEGEASQESTFQSAAINKTKGNSVK